MRFTSSRLRYGTASLCVVIITCVIDKLYFDSQTQTTLKEVNQSQAPQRKIDVSEIQIPKQAQERPLDASNTRPANRSAQASNSLAELATNEIRQVVFVDLTLPEPMHKQDFQAPLNTVENPMPIKVLESNPISQPRNTKNAVSETSKEAQLSEEPQLGKEPQLSNHQRQITSHPKTIKRQSSSYEINQRIKELASLPAQELTLIFPQANISATLDYMHNCIGIDLGAIYKNQLTVFSHKNVRHSQIIRVANGYTNAHEKALLTLYAPTQTLVRLYPVSFDERLGNFINGRLGKSPLKGLRGEYELQNNSLYLTNISVNNINIKDRWLLRRGC